MPKEKNKNAGMPGVMLYADLRAAAALLSLEERGLLLDAINRAKTLYFTNRYHWDEVVQRDMDKDVSWENSAKQYKELYLELTQW